MSVGLVIVSHSAQLARGVVELAGQMAQGKVVLADAGGAEGEILGTSVEKILGAIQQVDTPDGVLVLLDLGSALLSTEMALEMLDDEQRAHTRLSYAPLVEGTLAAALEASLGRPLKAVQEAAEKAAHPEQLRQLKPIEQEELEASTPPAEESQSISPPVVPAAEQLLTLHNPAGLHARPASLFVQTVARFQANVTVQAKGKQANATSIMEVLSLGARQGDTITLRADGAEANEALTALSELVQANFHEQPAAEATALPAQGDKQTPTLKTPPAGHDPWRGISTSPGVAIGSALLYTDSALSLASVPQRSISPNQVAGEQEAVRTTLDKTAQELTVLAREVQGKIGKSEAGIFEAQAMMLQDPVLLDATLQAIESRHIDAASALAVAGEEQASTLEQLGNELLAQRASDVRDVMSRAIRALRGQEKPKQDLRGLKQPIILVARDLTPSDTAQLKPEMVLGICTVQGGSTAHAAILARALGIPAMAGLNEAALSTIHTGDELALDAGQGLLYHKPGAEIRSQFTQQVAEQEERRQALQHAAQQAREPVMLNGRHIHLLSNIGSEAEAEAARQWGAEGIGLLRSEFLFANAQALPDEDEQRERYARIFRAFKGNTEHAPGPIVVRTLDAGADKPLPALDAAIGAKEEANPALGQRGIRIHLAHQALLEQQIEALLLAADETGVELHIMFPMISAIEELRTARAIFERIQADTLKRCRREQPQKPVRLGIMVEVPAAAIMASEMAQLADFFSIGANDLLQYTLACDRTNTDVANLYNPMQPALLRAIKQIADAGHQAGIPVALCGEIGGDPRLAPLLLGLGVDELSMTPTAIPLVRAALAGKSAQEINVLVEKVLQAQTVSEVEQACAEFAQ